MSGISKHSPLSLLLVPFTSLQQPTKNKLQRVYDFLLCMKGMACQKNFNVLVLRQAGKQKDKL